MLNTLTELNQNSAEENGSSAQKQRRKRILDATVELATKGGFDAVQMRAVAERADVALGTVYRYFPSKIHLLVAALAGQYDLIQGALVRKPLAGETAEDRVLIVLHTATKGLQKAPKLTEAMTRAFMFADSSVANEIHTVGLQLSGMIAGAIKGNQVPSEPKPEDIAIAKVISDVWLSNLVAWVTGRASVDDVNDQIDMAVRLLLRQAP